MRWLIDGYNVIRRDPDLRAREAESLQAGRAALLAVLARLASEVSDIFTVVFDGARTSGGSPSPGRVQVLFSRPPETADDVLRRLAGTLREAAVVVTSDRAVQDSARRAGAVTVGAEDFLEAAGGGGGDDPGDTEDTEDSEARPSRGGPSRRPSREARAAQRVLRRLRKR
jgi:predicted RNA-binding protein with PIN domain